MRARAVLARLSSLGPRSLRMRVFLAILIVGAIPIIIGMGWLILVEATNPPAADVTTRPQHQVLEAWSRAQESQRGSWVTQPLVDVAAMRDRLPSSEYRDLVFHLQAISEAAGSESVYTTESSNRFFMEGPGSVLESPEARRRLRDSGYFWGQGWYTWHDSSAVRDGVAKPVERSELVPVVAWMPTSRIVRLVRVVPFEATQDGTSAPFYPPVWWIAAVLGVSFACLIGLALLATALGMRGATKPLRRMVTASSLVADGRDVDEVPETGPPEIKDLAVAFNSMAAKTARAQEAEQSFLLSVSHELKTPLTAIQGYGETLSEGRADPKTAGEVIIREASRLKRLVQDVLDLGRARKSSFAVREEAIDLTEIAGDVKERYAAQAREFGLDLRVEATGPAPALADADRVLQVASNLVENALRCTPSEGAVTIAASPGRLRVTDTGPGLVGADLDRAFERFFLYERCGRDRQVGSGLGLAIVKELTEAMNGSVTVESRLGVGTSFEVTLPLANA